MRTIAFAYHDISGAGVPASGFAGRDAARYRLDKAQLEAHARTFAGSNPPDQQILITFDDGGSSALTSAGILESQRLRGHFFIITDRIGARTFLSAAEIRDLHGRGHAIGTHSRSHPRRMSSLPTNQLLAEWRDSRARLSDLLGADVTAGAVPGGYYARQVGAAASEAGLEMLFTLRPTTRVNQIDGCTICGRYTVVRDTSADEIRQLLAGRFAPRLRRAFFWSLREAAKRLSGAQYIRLRKALLDGFGSTQTERG